MESLIFILFWTYQVYLGAVNVPILYFGFVASAISVVNIIFMNIIPAISKRLKNKMSLLITVELICGIAYILLGFTFNPILGILLIFSTYCAMEEQWTNIRSKLFFSIVLRIRLASLGE